MNFPYFIGMSILAIAGGLIISIILFYAPLLITLAFICAFMIPCIILGFEWDKMEMKA